MAGSAGENKKVRTQQDFPLVSIIMPVYNREKFLPQAIKSILEQTYKHWELIIVDDGSSDGSVDLLNSLTATFTQSATIIKQENQGPAVARNTGILKGNGDFFAFFDSDDLWFPYHLKHCLHAFSEHPKMSWIYAACERIEYASGECLLPSTFYTDAQPNKLFEISERQSDGLYILDNSKAVLLQLTAGIDNGLQNSVLRKEVLKAHLLPNFRVGEDRLFIIMALKNGFRMGFIDAIHVRYHVHSENISDTNKKEGDFSKRIKSLEMLIDAKRQLPQLVTFNAEESQLYRSQLSKEIFWELGYSLYQASGDYTKAIANYWDGIKLAPISLKYYKTLLLAYFKRFFKR
jgi:glycosyltransferase involved in cell wall biosynthesis